MHECHWSVFCPKTSRPQTAGGAVSLSSLCCLTEIFGPLLPPLLRLFLPLIQLHSIWEKRQNKMFSFGETFWNWHFCFLNFSFYPIKLSWTAIKRDRDSQTAGCREWERLLCGKDCAHICSSTKHWKLAAAETGNIHTLRLKQRALRTHSTDTII